MVEKNKLAFLHPLRFIFAISIVLWHISFGFDTYIRGGENNIVWGLRELTRYGGNQAFLLICGMMFYIAYYNKLQSGELTIKEFLKKRAIRIYPAVILTCVIAYIFALIRYFTYWPNENINIMHLFFDSVLFGGRLVGGDYGIYNGPIWFLSVLLVCYLLSCFIIYITRKKKSLYWFLIPLCIFFLSGHGSDVIVPIFHVERIANECFNFFLGLFFMFFLTKFENFGKKIKITVKILCSIMFIIFIYMYYSSHGNNPLGMGEMVGSMFCWIPLFTVLYGSKINILFDNKFFKLISNSSFYVFLWHIPLYMGWLTMFAIWHIEFKNQGFTSMLIFLMVVVAISIGSVYLFKYLNKKIFSRPKKEVVTEEVVTEN